MNPQFGKDLEKLLLICKSWIQINNSSQNLKFSPGYSFRNRCLLRIYNRVDRLVSIDHQLSSYLALDQSEVLAIKNAANKVQSSITYLDRWIPHLVEAAQHYSLQPYEVPRLLPEINRLYSDLYAVVNDYCLLRPILVPGLLNLVQEMDTLRQKIEENQKIAISNNFRPRLYAVSSCPIWIRDF